jgi:DNA-binding NtrC family response regulator
MKHRSILIVEDNLIFGQTLAQALRLEGRDQVQVAVCGSAEEARQMFTASPYDLLICDFRLPGEDGLSLITSLKEKHPEIDAVLMTGVGNPELETKAGEVAEGYLAKPFDMLDLMLMVEQVVRPENASPLPAAAHQSRQYRVLLLEDDDGLRNIYTRALCKNEAFQVDAAATLAEARTLLDRQEYDLLISDIRIGRERATDILDEYRDKFSRRNTKVVMCSAFGQYRDLPTGVDQFVEKPISLNDLVRLVSELVSKGERTDD